MTSMKRTSFLLCGLLTATVNFVTDLFDWVKRRSGSRVRLPMPCQRLRVAMGCCLLFGELSGVGAIGAGRDLAAVLPLTRPKAEPTLLELDEPPIYQPVHVFANRALRWVAGKMAREITLAPVVAIRHELQYRF